MKRVLIVGGVAGGASAAARLRRLDENIEIIMNVNSTSWKLASSGKIINLNRISVFNRIEVHI